MHVFILQVVLATVVRRNHNTFCPVRGSADQVLQVMPDMDRFIEDFTPEDVAVCQLVCIIWIC